MVSVAIGTEILGKSYYTEGIVLAEEKSENFVIPKNAVSMAAYALIGILVLLVVFNQLQINAVSSAIASAGLSTGSSITGSAGLSSGLNAVSGASAGTLQLSDVLPSGVPAVYGAELNLRYDDVSVTDAAKANAAITKMSVFDNGISLSGEKLQRYIAVTTNISCEYCCGAQAITFPNGNAACGCAHSAAMRGLAKYLLDKHASEFTNDQILEELGKWKALYFPSNMLAKANVLKEKGIELNYINLASNKYKGIESGAGSGTQVGGC